MTRRSLLLALAGCLLAAPLLGSCGAISKITPFGGGGFDLEVRNGDAQAVESLFVVVGDEGELEDSSAEGTIRNLVRPERHRTYRTFAQYKPGAGEPPRWEEIHVQPEHPQVGLTIAEDGALHVAIDDDIFDAHPESCVAILVHYSNGPWKAEKVLRPEIENTDRLRIVVGPTDLERRAVE